MPKATGQHFSNVKTEAKWYATSTEESDGELLSDFEAYNTVHRTDIPDTKMDNQTPMMGNLTESAGLGSRSSLKDKRRSVSESVLNAMERLKTGGRLMRGKPNSVQVGLVPPPLPTTMKRRPSRSLDSINRTFDRQFDRGETSTPRPNGSGLEFFGDFKLRPVEIALEDIFTPGSAAFDGLKVSFDAGFSDLVEEVLAKQISLVSNRSTTEDQNLRTPGSRRNRSQSATELRSFCEPSESDPKKSSNPIESPGSRSKFVVDETDFLHSEMRRMAIIQMKSPGASHEESGNDVFNSHLNSPPFHDAESLAVKSNSTCHVYFLLNSCFFCRFRSTQRHAIAPASLS